MWMQCEFMSLLKCELVIQILIDAKVVRLSKSQLVAVRQLKLIVVVALHIQCSGVPLMALPQSQLPAMVVVVVPEYQLVIVVMVPQPQVMVVRLAKYKFMVVFMGLAQDKVVVVVVAAEIELVAMAEAQPMVLAEVVVVLPQRKLRVLPVPEDELVVRHRRSTRQQRRSFRVIPDKAEIAAAATIQSRRTQRRRNPASCNSAKIQSPLPGKPIQPFTQPSARD